MPKSGGRAAAVQFLSLLGTAGTCLALSVRTPPSVRTSSPVACATPQSQTPQNPTVSSSSGAQCFLFTSCQAGSEKLLKAELARTHPELRFAYSRPGLVTFKNSSTDGSVSPAVTLRSSFSRVHGASVGQARTAPEVCELARRLPSVRPPLCLHVWSRDLAGARAMHPTAVSERAARVVALRRELQSCAPDIWAPSEIAQEGAPVLSVILGEGDEPYFVGVHTHQSYEEEGVPPRGAGAVMGALNATLGASSAARGRGAGGGTSGHPIFGSACNRPIVLRRAHVPHAGALFPGLEQAR